MKSRKSLFIGVMLLLTTGIAASFYNENQNNFEYARNTPLFVLQSTKENVLSDSFVSDLAVSSSKDNKDVFLFREDTQEINIIDEILKTERKKTSAVSAKEIVINDQGRIFIGSDSSLSVFDAKGKRLNNFPIPENTTSLATFGDNGIVVAAVDSEKLITVYDLSGKVIREFGKLKQLDRNTMQNRFLNSGKVAVNKFGEVFYISTFSPNPSVQKFSSQGELLKEFVIEGATTELQLERAKDFLNEKKITCVGGYHVIRAMSIDPTTGNLWIGMNGLSETGAIREESGVLYEYNTDGNKIAEYALEISLLGNEMSILTDVKDIAVNFPYAYISTSQGRAYRFNLNQRLEATPKKALQKDNLVVSFIRNKLELLSPTVSAQSACPDDANFSCFDSCPAGSSPASATCDAELRSGLQQGERIISGNCSTGTTVSQNGGCSATITGCRTNGVRVTYSTTINCNAAPTPTPEPEPTATPEGYEGLEYVAGGGYSCQLCEDAGDNDYDGTIDLGDVGCQNCIPSPILIDTFGNGFEMSSVANGVMFDITANGRERRVSWTQGIDEAWLALDRNGNGKIDNGAELFGNFTPQPGTGEPNGFVALAEYDKPNNGGNNDNEISRQDSIFDSLRLWKDINRNGISEQGELHPLLSLNVEKIGLEFKRSKLTDEYGNQFRFKAKVFDTKKGGVGRWSWDVFLATQ